MDSFNFFFLLWLCLAFGGIGLVITMSGYVAQRIMRPKDQVPSANRRVSFRVADLDEQDQRLKALGIDPDDPARLPQEQEPRR